MASQQRVNDLLERGLQLFGLGQQSEALALWQEVLQLEPQNPRAHEYLRFVFGEKKASSLQNNGLQGNVSSAPEPAMAVQNTAASSLLGQSWGDLLTAPDSSSSPDTRPDDEPKSQKQESPAATDVKTESKATGVEQKPAQDSLVSSPDPQLAESAEAKVLQADKILPVQSGPPQASADDEVLPDKFSAGTLLTSPPSELQQPALAREDSSHNDSEKVTPSSLAENEQNQDPWEEGNAITQTVTVSADEEFLEPLSGEFDIEEHSHDPATNPKLQPGRHDLDGENAQSQKPKDALETLMQGAREMFSLGDFSGTLELTERVLQQNPEHAEAQEMAQRCRKTLLQMYESKIGDFSVVPHVTIPPDDVIWLNLHHRAGFLLSQIDGTVSYDDILSLSGMSRFETCKILVELLEQGVVAG